MANKKSSHPKPPTANSTPEMKSAWSAYQSGNSRVARQQAREVLAGGAPEAAKTEAKDLLRRTSLDPHVKLTWLVMVLVIIGIVIALALR